MSNKIQHKLLELEVIPPSSLWQKLEEELNQASGDKTVSTKFDQLEIAVPAAAWHNIAAALEPAPEMDLTAKLREAAVVPPPSVWMRIEKSLSSPAIIKRARTRYAAAAVLAGLLFSAAYFLSFSSNERSAASNKEADLIKKEIKKDNALPVVSEEQLNDRALEQSKHTYASVNIDRKKISRIASAYKFAVAEEITPPTETGNTDINDRYIVLMTPEGNFIRVSKKLGDLVCCVSGEEEDRSCKEQVGKWQKQLACADILHAGNFGDILSLVSELQQEK